MFEGILFSHWLLAILGLVLYYLKIIAQGEELSIKEIFNRTTIVTLISSVIFIPILFYVCSEPGMSDIIPINNLTAVIAGYQTQDMMTLLFNVGISKFKISDEDKNDLRKKYN